MRLKEKTQVQTDERIELGLHVCERERLRERVASTHSAYVTTQKVVPTRSRWRPSKPF